MTVFFISLSAVATISAVQIPVLLRRRQIKELWVFSLLSLAVLVAFYLVASESTAMQSMLRAMEAVFNPIGRLIMGPL